jgi:ABC-type nitrate/sulfonate/bicarbonate transport system substrate-binding protein
MQIRLRGSLARGPMLLLTAALMACGAHGTANSSASGSATAKPAQAAAPKHLNWATTGFTWPGLPDMVAQGKGFYAAENLTVDQVVAGQSAAVCQQILARAVDIGSCNLNDMGACRGGQRRAADPVFHHRCRAAEPDGCRETIDQELVGP